MSLKDWFSNGWLRKHQTNSQQISDLFAIVDRDLEDAKTARLSTDWQFGIAYNATLKYLDFIFMHKIIIVRY